MQKITPFLWFDDQAEEAMNFYTSIFPNSRVVSVSRQPAAGPGQPGRVFSVVFELEGQEYFGLNGGPHYAFSPAISFFVKCATQAEVDRYWDALSAGGTRLQCGWLTDRFGVTWQVVPDALGRMLDDPDRAKSQRVMQAMMKMVKLDIAGLESAFRGT